MPTGTSLALFLVVVVGVMVTPGPSALFAMGLGMQHGRRVGLAAVAGLETGLLFHVVIAACGLSAVVAAAPNVLVVLKVSGAAYLAFLGLRRFLVRASVSVVEPTQLSHSAGRAYADAVVVDVLNPKTMLLVLALLPRFVQADRGSPVLQMLGLGGVAVVLALACDGAYAVAGSALGRQLGRRVDLRRMTRISGLLLLGVAVLTVAP